MLGFGIKIAYLVIMVTFAYASIMVRLGGSDRTLLYREGAHLQLLPLPSFV